jgi:hypothetical protein
MLLDVEADRATVTTPPFRCGTIVAPFARIEWGAEKLPADASARLRWQIEGQEGWQPAYGSHGKFVAEPWEPLAFEENRG